MKPKVSSVDFVRAKGALQNNATCVFDSAGQIANRPQRYPPSNANHLRNAFSVAVKRFNIHGLKTIFGCYFYTAQQTIYLHPQDIDLRLHLALHKQRSALSLAMK